MGIELKGGGREMEGKGGGRIPKVRMNRSRHGRAADKKVNWITNLSHNAGTMPRSGVAGRTRGAYHKIS